MRCSVLAQHLLPCVRQGSHIIVHALFLSFKNELTLNSLYTSFAAGVRALISLCEKKIDYLSWRKDWFSKTLWQLHGGSFIVSFSRRTSSTKVSEKRICLLSELPGRTNDKCSTSHSPFFSVEVCLFANLRLISRCSHPNFVSSADTSLLVHLVFGRCRKHNIDLAMLVPAQRANRLSPKPHYFATLRSEKVVVYFHCGNGAMNER